MGLLVISLIVLTPINSQATIPLPAPAGSGILVARPGKATTNNTAEQTQLSKEEFTKLEKLIIRLTNDIVQGNYMNKGGEITAGDSWVTFVQESGGSTLAYSYVSISLMLINANQPDEYIDLHAEKTLHYDYTWKIARHSALFQQCKNLWERGKKLFLDINKEKALNDMDNIFKQ